MRDVCRHYRQNLKRGAAISLLVYSGAAWAQTYGWSYINDFPKPFFGGATLMVLAMAATGTLIGLALSPPLEKRKNLYIVAPACTVMSSWLLMLAQNMGYIVVPPIALPPLAGVVAAIGIVVIPPLWGKLPEVAGSVIEALKAAISRFFNRGGTP